MEMIALKRVKYPHGNTGREYAPGEAFTALSERDAKALSISGKARPCRQGRAKAAPSSPAALPAAAMTTPDPNQDGESRLQYQRRDMQAQDGQTGEATSPPSSRRGRRRNAPTSAPSEDAQES